MNPQWVGDLGSRVSQTWPQADAAVLLPFSVFDEGVVSEIEITGTGTAATMGNYDLGLYRDNGNGTATRLASTGAQPYGAHQSVPLRVAIEPEKLTPGKHFLAAAFDNATAQVIGRNTSELLGFHELIIPGAYPLPDEIDLSTALTPYAGAFGGVALVAAIT